MLTQSYSRFSWLNEVASCKVFRLGWEQALLDPIDRGSSDPDAFDVNNRVKANNYDLEYYIANKNLKLTLPTS